MAVNWISVCFGTFPLKDFYVLFEETCLWKAGLKRGQTNLYSFGHKGQYHQKVVQKLTENGNDEGNKVPKKDFRDCQEVLCYLICKRQECCFQMLQ